MIEPLPPGGLPLPSSPGTKDAGARVPAFLPWAMPERQAPPPMPSPSVSPAIQPSIPPSSMPSPPAPPWPASSMPSVSMADDVRVSTGIAPSLPGAANPLPDAILASIFPDASLPPAVLSPPNVGASNEAFQAALQAPVDASVSISTQSTPPLTDTIAIRVEAHFVDPRAGREIVVVPMRLCATGHLAQAADASSWSADDHGPLVAAPPIPTPMAAKTSLVPRPPIVGTYRLHPHTTEVEEGALQAWTPSFRTDDAGAEEDTPSRPLSTAADTATWLIRRLALVQQAGRAPTLWLRDYRLDPDEALRIGDTLHRLARDRGVVLDRIVINGHEHGFDSRFSSIDEPQE